jgi:hypothetical protein
MRALSRNAHANSPARLSTQFRKHNPQMLGFVAALRQQERIAAS